LRRRKRRSKSGRGEEQEGKGKKEEGRVDKLANERAETEQSRQGGLISFERRRRK